MRYRISKKSRNSKPGSVVNSWAVLVFCALALAFLGKAAFNAYLEKRQSDQSLAAAKMELAKLEEREAFISGELKKVESEEGIEAKLRQKFGLAREGEQVAIIIESEEEMNTQNSQSFLVKIKAFFSSLIQK